MSYLIWLPFTKSYLPRISSNIPRCCHYDQYFFAKRDLYQTLLEQVGAQVFVFERLEEFIQIDTEAVSVEDMIKR